MQFELGADGTNGKIDCIHLCYIVLDHLGIEAPAFKASWSESGKYETLRDLLLWGDRVLEPEYDGDILLLPQQSWAFAVLWQKGVLYINERTRKVAWSSVRMFTKLHCFRTKSSSLQQLVQTRKSTGNLLVS